MSQCSWQNHEMEEMDNVEMTTVKYQNEKNSRGCLIPLNFPSD